MKIASFTIAALLAIPLHERISATRPRGKRRPAHPWPGSANNLPSKYYFKGQKMKVETGDTAVFIDFRAHTITTVNSKRKTISVRNLGVSESTAQAGDAGAKIDVRETGQTKTIDGHHSTEMLLTTNLDSAELRTMGSRIQMEMDVWLSPDIPGAGELHKFYEENLDRFPWEVLGGGGNPAIQTGLSDLRSKIAGMNGVQVLEIVKVKPAGGPPSKPLTHAESARIRDRIAELDDKAQKGGPEGTAAVQEMSRLKAMVGDDFVAGPLFEITIESTGFSTSSIPNSVFAIPAGYQRAETR